MALGTDGQEPNPAFSHIQVPLASTFILSSKEGKEAFVQPVLGKSVYTFTVKVGRPPADLRAGTKGRDAFSVPMPDVRHTD